VTPLLTWTIAYCTIRFQRSVSPVGCGCRRTRMAAASANAAVVSSSRGVTARRKSKSLCVRVWGEARA
jgi:hypothetical protein